MQQAARIHCVFIILCWSFKLCSTSPSAPGSPPSRACFHSFMFSILFSSFHFFFDDPPHHPYLSLSPLLLLLLIFLSPHVSFFLLPPYFSPFASFYFLSLVSLCGSKRCFFAWFYWTHLSASLLTLCLFISYFFFIPSLHMLSLSPSVIFSALPCPRSSSYPSVFSSPPPPVSSNSLLSISSLVYLLPSVSSPLSFPPPILLSASLLLHHLIFLPSSSSSGSCHGMFLFTSCFTCLLVLFASVSNNVVS